MSRWKQVAGHLPTVTMALAGRLRSNVPVRQWVLSLPRELRSTHARSSRSHYPPQQKWNEKGYNFGAALAHPVTVAR